MTPRRCQGLIVAAVIVSTFPYSTSVEAHVHSDYYDAVWDTSSLIFRYDRDFPESVGVYTWRERIEDGRSNWPAGTVGRPTINFEDNETNYTQACVSGGTNVIDYYSLSVNANTCIVRTGTRINNARIAIDSAGQNWYVSDSPTPIPAPYNTTHRDLESVATHEFGHALGSLHNLDGTDDENGHFALADVACPGPVGDTSQDSMCAGGTPLGSTYRRSTQSHDQNTMAGAYNNLP